MEYICNNHKCPNYGKKEYFSSETYKYRNGRLVGEHIQCPECGVEREEVNPNKDIPLSEKNIGIGLFASMSKEQKQEVLKSVHMNILRKSGRAKGRTDEPSNQ